MSGHTAFSPVDSLEWCNNTVIMTQLQISYFISSEKSLFHMVDNQSITVNALFASMLILLSEDEILPLRNMNWSTNFRDLPFKEMGPS